MYALLHLLDTAGLQSAVEMLRRLGLKRTEQTVAAVRAAKVSWQLIMLYLVLVCCGVSLIVNTRLNQQALPTYS
jgi:hypothetical protein